MRNANEYDPTKDKGHFPNCKDGYDDPALDPPTKNVPIDSGAEAPSYTEDESNRPSPYSGKST